MNDVSTPETGNGLYSSHLQIPADHFVDRSGAWKRRHMEEEKRYDAAYVEKYNQYDCSAMSHLRFNELVLECDLARGCSILDFGCGNGAFLREAAASKLLQPTVYGWDIAGYPLHFEMRHPAGMELDLITFFDSLEHICEADALLSSFKARYAIVSLPWCHGRVMGVEWFAEWKHNRPNEHWWYFDAASLCNLMARHGYKPIFVGNPEDKVRKATDHLPNILTGIFKHEYENN